MTKYLRQVQVIDEYDRPVPGATIYVFDGDGNDAQLYADEDGTVPLALGEPLTADEFGVVSYYGDASVYREDTHFAGKLRFKEVTPVGLDGLYPPRADRAGNFFAFDADNNPVAASGTGADAGLRTDLAADTGFTLIKSKPAGTGTYGRSAAERALMGGEETDGVNLIHYVDSALDDDILAGTNSTALDTAFANAHADLTIAQASRAGRTRLYAPAFEFLSADSLNFGVPDLVIEGPGATFKSTKDGKAFGFNGDRQTVRHVRLYQAATGADPAPYIDIDALNVTFDQVINDRDALGHVPMYLRGVAADGFTMWGGISTWYGGINNLGASNVLLFGADFINPSGSGSDDGYAIKSSAGLVVTNNTISHCYFYGVADMVGIGSEIGHLAGADPTYANRVYNTQILNNRGENCVRMVMLKGGGVDGVDYRDGWTDTVLISGNQNVDNLGTNQVCGILIEPGRGHAMRNISGKENKCIGRTKTGSANTALWIYVRNDGTGTVDSVVDEVNLGIEVQDPFGGVANGVVVNGVAAPGAPWESGCRVEKADSAHGTVSNVSLDLVINGTSNNGAVIGAGLDDAVHIERARMSNINAAGLAAGGAFRLSSRISMTADVRLSVVSGQYYAFETTAGDVVCPELTEECYLGSFTAGATTALAVSGAGKAKGVLISLGLLSSSTIAQDATNFTGFNFANLDLAGTTFGTWKTATTGVSGSDKRSALTANTIATMYHRNSVTSTSDRAQALFDFNGRLQLTKTNGGTGVALNDARVVVRCAPR